MKKKPRFVVTAGPTREHLDPVRFLSNPSTGKMGFAIAAAAAAAGHDTTLVSGPSLLKTPRGVRRIDVISARDMLKAVRSLEGDDAVLVSAAAIADWRPAKRAVRKLRKSEIADVIRLVRNPDVLKSTKFPTKVGFAAQTHDVIREAARKCREKRLAFIVANDVTE
jgi:phosphopantothenoylcysteine decarboxylase/phosphopantothenate--cysteine ligase